MKIGILSRRETGFVQKIKQLLIDEGISVKVYTPKNLYISESLLKNDFFILKSKKTIFLYAAYYLESNNIPIFPNPSLCYNHRNRIQAHSLISRAKLLSPKYFVGSPKMHKKKLKSSDFPLVQKPIMGSESKGVYLINSVNDLNPNEKRIYLEKQIIGEHYNVHFIEDEIQVFKKKRFTKGIENPLPLAKDIEELVSKWKRSFNGGLIFGHLDVVREEDTNQLYIVDVGTFPQFSNWTEGRDPIKLICEIILKQIDKIRN